MLNSTENSELNAARKMAIDERAVTLVSTSVADCRTSLAFVTDLDVLNSAFNLCQREGSKTKAKILASRISKLLKNPLLQLTCPCCQLKGSLETNPLENDGSLKCRECKAETIARCTKCLKRRVICTCN